MYPPLETMSNSLFNNKKFKIEQFTDEEVYFRIISKFDITFHLVLMRFLL